MKTFVKRLLALIGVFLIFYLVKDNSFALIIIMTLYIRHIYLSINKVDNKINILNKNINIKEQQPNYSYKLKISIAPSWDEIAKEIFLKTKLMDESISRDDLEENSLFGIQEFSFIKIFNSSTALELIWSDFNKTFIEELGVRGYLFKEKSVFAEYLAKKKIKTITANPFQPYFCITPEMLGFSDETISSIPFSSIIPLLIGINKHLPGLEMNEIKKFPKKIEEELNKFKVEYRPDMPFDKFDYGSKRIGSQIKSSNGWYNRQGLVLTTNRVENHIFQTKFYSIYVNLQMGLKLD